MLVVAVVATAAAEQHSWTFIQDGKMRSPSGDEWSFKKEGRVDGAFVSLEGTNVLVLGAYDGKLRLIPIASLCEDDRAYLLRANGISGSEVVEITQTAVAKRAEAGRKADAARFKAEAASKRRLAQLEIEGAQRLENDAGRLGSRAASLEGHADYRARFADRIENSAVVPPKVGFAYVTAKANAAVMTDAAGRLEEDMVRLRREAGEKRANADRLWSEAAQLEAMARSMEWGAGSGIPAPR